MRLSAPVFCGCTGREVYSPKPLEVHRKGRYCLNDLHKAAGGSPDHAPGQWVRLQGTSDLIQELWSDTPGWNGTGQANLIMGNHIVGPIESTPGRYGGTFVVKELVYAYAMWISAKFHLQVIRAYDQLRSNDQLVTAPRSWHPPPSPTPLVKLTPRP